MNNIDRAEKKIDAAINGNNGRDTNNNLLLQGIALLLLELVRPKGESDEA